MSAAGATLHGWPPPQPNSLARAWRAVARRPWLLALAISSLVVLLARLGPDWPAQEFRAHLAHDVGLTAWNDQWYGGHPLSGYSLLYPPVAAVFGAAFTGVLAAVGCTWLVTRLLPPVDAGRRWFGVAAAVCVAGNLFLGQVPFLLGLFFGLAAFLAVLRAEPSSRASAVVALLAAACSLASPLAGFFLLLAGFTWAFDAGWRRALPLGAAVAGAVVSLVVGGSGGPFPFPWDGLLDLMIFVAATLVLVPRRYALLRRFVVVYALVAVVSFVVPNPVGGNVIRLAQLLAVPAAFWMLARHRKVLAVLGIALLPALFWQFYPIGSAAAHAAGDPSVSSSYYTGLLRFLGTQDPADGRLEIPFTREHWEAARVAPYFPIARGWERQTDYKYDAVLYDTLTPASYRQWLASAGVDLVALPDAPIDYGGRAEKALLAHAPAYLVPIWHDAHWQVWKVAGAEPLVSGPATLTKLGTSSFSLDFSAPGDAVVRVRMSSLWQVTEGTGCVLPAEPDGWVHVRATEPGELTARARVTLSSVLPSDQNPPC
ncbi:MAG: hypothetical protein ACRDTP_02230 [Mycobacteriales bacterium]